jgi:hypothetical protein
MDSSGAATHGSTLTARDIRDMLAATLFWGDAQLSKKANESSCFFDQQTHQSPAAKEHVQYSMTDIPEDAALIVFYASNRQRCNVDQEPGASLVRCPR